MRHPQLADTVRIYVKGAPEIVVQNCVNHYLSTPATTPEGERYEAAQKQPLS